MYQLCETDIRAMLASGLCSIVYIKKNGDTRNAVATTCLQHIPADKQPLPPSQRKVQPWVKDDYVRYYDLTVQEWRTLVVSEIIQCKPLNVNPNV